MDINHPAIGGIPISSQRKVGSGEEFRWLLGVGPYWPDYPRPKLAAVAPGHAVPVCNERCHRITWWQQAPSEGPVNDDHARPSMTAEPEQRSPALLL
jgi:hypothetical protein